MLGNIFPLYAGTPSLSDSSVSDGGWDYVCEGPPAADLGVNGETAFDAASATACWYQKVDGAWTLRGHLKGELGERGEAGAALRISEVMVDLVSTATVPVVDLEPNSWVQLAALSVEIAADASAVQVDLLDADGEPIQFLNALDHQPPTVDASREGSLAVWPPFMSLQGGILAVRVITEGGTVGALRARIVHGPLDARP